MYIDREKALLHPIASIPFDVERGRLRFFAKATGQTDPIYSDPEAARAAGHREIPVPLTFLSTSLELEYMNPLAWLAELGGDLTKTTHAQQAFKYHKLAYAGDSLVLERKIVDVYTKKNGALEFVVKRNDVKRCGETLLEAMFTIALRHPEAEA